MDRLIALRLLCRSVNARNAVTKQNLHTSVRHLSGQDSSSSSDSSDSSDSDNEKPKKGPKRVIFKEARDDNAKQQTVDLLNDLLAKMNGEKLVTKTIDIAIPPKKPKIKKIKKTLEEQLTDAAKEVAKTLGGDVQKREDELLQKIFSAGAPAQQEPILTPQKTGKKQKKKKNVEEPASDIPPAVETKSEDEPKVETPEPSLSDLLAGMKIDRTPKKVIDEDGLTISRSEKVKELAAKFQAREPTMKSFGGMMKELPGGLYAGKRFNILEKNAAKEPISLDTWRELDRQELKMLVVHPPENYFEELIQWTEKGILWKFPIDNEQGMEAEHNVHFSEHVFLEKHLVPWCPKKGPLRHFMDLVCVGLSKNPYMTVKEKKEHISWYRDYFGGKQDLLKEVGALDKDILPARESQKQIDA